MSIALALSTSIVLFQNCAEDLPIEAQQSSTATDGSATVAPPTLALTADKLEIETEQTAQLSAAGGTAPYAFSVATGSGLVSSTGLFTAPEVAEANVLEVQDFAGAKSSITISVLSPLSLNFSPASPNVGTPVQLMPAGGKSPFVYAVEVGAGTISGNTYTPGGMGELTARLKVTDARGVMVSRDIAFGIPCGGVMVGGHCWYLGTFGASCTSVCASRGGYDPATSTYAGRAGTGQQCENVMVALGLASGVISTSCSATPAAGCLLHTNSNRVRCTNAETTASAANASYRRACACAN